MLLTKHIYFHSPNIYGPIWITKWNRWKSMFCGKGVILKGNYGDVYYNF